MFDRDAVRLPANDPRPDSPWATWPVTVVRAWGDVAVAGVDSWFATHQMWMATARDVGRPSVVAPKSETDPLIAATIQDWRACGDALIQMQLEAIAPWRRAS